MRIRKRKNLKQIEFFTSMKTVKNDSKKHLFWVINIRNRRKK